MASKITLKVAGLYLNSNSLGTVPPGALVEAVNVVIDKNDIVESRRGFKVYGDDMNGSFAKQLLNYRDTLLRHYSDVLEYDSASEPGTFTAYKQLKWIYASSLTSAGTTATFVANRPHGLVTGDSVVISGANEAEYNGTFVATVVDSATFTYTLSNSTTSPATGDIVLEEATAHIDQVDSNNKIRGVESFNSNFYFTSSNGVMKLDTLDGYVVKAGGVKALDLDLSLGNSNISGVLAQNSQLGYRVLWGYKDANNNLILGTPSQRATIALQIQDLLIEDFNTLLDKLDAAVAANGAASGPDPLSDTSPDYVSLAIPSTSTPADLNDALKALAAKIETDLGYLNSTSQVAKYGRSGTITSISAAGPTVITSNSHDLSNGDIVVISGSNSIPSIDGRYVVSNRTANTFEIAMTVTSAGTVGTWTSGIAADYPAPTTDTANDYLDQQAFFDDIVNNLLTEPTTKIVGDAQDAADFQNATQAKDVSVSFTVPKDITVNYFYQIYRTEASADALTDPGDDMGLVYESNPTAAEIVAGTITITDITPDDFRGADLYTNPRQEGITQSNSQPPYAKDIAIFKNIAFYGNTKTLHQKQISLQSVTDLIGTKINIANTTFTFGAAEDIATGTIGVETSGTPAQNVDTTARSIVRVVNRYSENTSVYAEYISGPDDVPGLILFQARDLDTPKFYIVSDDATVGARNFSPDISPGLTISAIATGVSTSQITTTTSHGMSTGDSIVFVNTDSTPSIDGLHTVTVVDSTKFTISVAVTGAGTSGKARKTRFAASSDNEEKKNRLYYSKQQQFEAVPITNWFDVGSGDKEILRVVPLRDSLFVLKQDGVYRVVGETPSNLSVSLMDASTRIYAPETAQVGNNQINCLSDQGVVVISDTGVEMISRPIENELLPLIKMDNVPSTAFGVFYQTDRKYILFMPEESTDEVATTAWVFNNITNAWTQWDMSKICGLVNTGTDKLYLGAADISNIEVERKDFARTDFADREYTKNVISYDSTTKVVKLDSLSNVSAGDVLVQQQTVTTPYLSYNINVEARIVEIDDNTRNTVLVDSPYDLQTGAITQYKGFETKITWAPEALGDPSMLKHVSEATVRFKKSRISQPILGFSTDIQQGAEEIPLIGPGLGLWGYFKWGRTLWGGETNQRAFRTYIPRGKQKCSIINCSFRSLTAREDWQIEGLTLAFEPGASRINR